MLSLPRPRRDSDSCGAGGAAPPSTWRTPPTPLSMPATWSTLPGL
nr:MAG TPA: hypothetical protein [Caudoviricetes sp.]